MYQPVPVNLDAFALLGQRNPLVKKLFLFNFEKLVTR